MARGVDDAEWGQIVEAVVVANGAAPTLDQLRDHVKATHPAYMAPRSLVLVDALPPHLDRQTPPFHHGGRRVRPTGPLPLRRR